MEIITITKENLAQEHICCAIAGDNDVQVCSKKLGSKSALTTDLYSKRATCAENALSSTYPPKPHVRPFVRTDICI